MTTHHPSRSMLTLAIAALALAAHPVQAEDNTGTGGTITYTDSSGLNPVASPPYPGGYVVHKFTSSGTLNLPVGVTADVLVVAGGGGGGGSTGGGGGAGGLISSNAFSVPPGDTTVIVGAGGNGGTGTGKGANGANSVFGNLTADGGGGGASNTESNANGLDGGSGGGASFGNGTGGTATAGQGLAGGNVTSWGTVIYAAGGGGGAFAAGVNGSSQSGGAAGGAGTESSISGSSVTYAGGGGGGVYYVSGNAGGGPGGSVIGGRGGAGPDSQTQPTSGAVNTGSGGGGQGGNIAGAAGSGGSGIVIVRYPYYGMSISTFNPANHATGVAVSSSLVVTFNQNVQKGTGNILLKKTADNSVIETIDVTSGQVAVSGASATITPAATLPAGTACYVEYASGVFIAASDSSPAPGIVGAATWSFTTAGSPTLLRIVDDKSGGPVQVGQAVTYTVTFSEDMDASTVDAASFGNAGSASVTIGTVTETAPAAGIFTVPVTPAGIGTLRLKVNAGAVLKDPLGTPLDTTSALLDDTTLTVAPAVVGSGGTITYTDPSGLNPRSSPPYFGGYVVHKFTSNGTFSMPGAANVNLLVVGGGGAGGGFGNAGAATCHGGGGGAGGLVYYGPGSSSLGASYPVAGGSGVSVVVGAGGAANSTSPYVGGSGADSSFGALIALGGGGGGGNSDGSAGGSGGGRGSTGAAGGGAATQPGSASGGYGMAGYIAGYFGGGGGAGVAGTPGQGGNGLQYSISGTATYYAGGGNGAGGSQAGGLGGGGSSLSAANSTPGAANTGGGGGGSWGWNAGAGGSGIVIVRYPYVNGPLISTLDPASNATGIAVSSSLVVTFDRDVQKATGNIVIKRSADNSVIETIDVASGQVAVAGPSATITPTAILPAGTSCYVQFPTGTFTATADSSLAVGILDTATWRFTTAGAPTLMGIVDDKSGGPIHAGQSVTYTVTFSEDMDASTVDATGFGNAGSAAITIGTVTETTSTAGIFTVPVTTTGTGTLQLKINAGAVLKDPLGNALDTTSALPDDTTITVNPDTTAPTPNPMTFAIAPGQAGPTSVAMTATTATDAWSPSVEYYFENTTISRNSGWITSTSWTDTGLTAGTTYGYRVKARDAAGNETGWSGVASAELPLPGHVTQDFELVSAGSSSPPAGWNVVTVAGQSGTYAATASGLGSNGTGGSSGLGGRLASTYTAFPGVYLVNSGFSTGLDVRWAITGSYDLNMAADAYGSCACLFGDIASGLPGTAGGLLEIVNKQSVFGNDPEQILNGAGTPLATLSSGGFRCVAGTWYRITFTWTPTIGTTGNFSYTVNAYSSGAWRPSYGNSVSGFTFAKAQAYFGFGTMRAPSTIFDNINIIGTAYGTPFDSDEDGLPDSFELAYTTPSSATSMIPGDNPDSDGLTNLQEYQLGTIPTNPDTDGDTLQDGPEVAGAGLRPPTSPILADSDGDGLSDGVESNTGTWVSQTNPGTHPLLADTDLDGLKDGVETNTGTFVSPTNTGTNPLLADTDSDSAGDWYEITASLTNPNNPSNKPNIPYPLPDPDASTGVTNKPVKVYIMSGQSNMVGEGVIGGALPGTLDTIAKLENKFPNLLNVGNGWTTRNDVRYRGVVTAIGNALLSPGQGSATTKFGPELGFGHVMGYHHGEPVLLLKSSQGNRALGWDFRPPGSLRYDYNGYTYPAYGESPEKWVIGTTPVPIGWCAGFQYDQCFLAEADMSPIAASSGAAGINVTDVLDNFAADYPQWAAQGFEIAGYVWWQGNRDIGTGPPYTTNYEANMVQFIKSLRAYYANRYAGKCSTTTPFVLATGCGDPGTGGNGLVVANAQLAMNNNTKYPEFAGNVKTMDTRSYWRDTSVSPATGGHHYNGNAETFMLTGDALGRAMIDLLGSGTPTGFASWQAANSTTGALSGDHDGDGVPNGIEWFLKGSSNSTGFTGLPGVTTTGGTLSVTWTKDAGYTGTYGTDFVVETSATLTGTWTPETLGDTVTIIGNAVKYTFPSPLGGKNFARLKVTGP